MKTRNPFAKVLSTTVIIIFFSATSPQDAFADHGWRTLVGSWFVEVTPDETSPPAPPAPPPFTNLATLNWTQTIITSDPELGAGHGAWKRTGRRDFELKFLTLVPVDNPLGLPPGSILTVTAWLTVDNSGDSASGRNIGEFSGPGPDGTVTVLAVVEGDVTFTRIKVDRW